VLSLLTLDGSLSPADGAYLRKELFRIVFSSPACFPVLSLDALVFHTPFVHVVSPFWSSSSLSATPLSTAWRDLVSRCQSYVGRGGAVSVPSSARGDWYTPFPDDDFSTSSYFYTPPSRSTVRVPLVPGKMSLPDPARKLVPLVDILPLALAEEVSSLAFLREGWEDMLALRPKSSPSCLCAKEDYPGVIGDVFEAQLVHLSSEPSLCEHSVMGVPKKGKDVSRFVDAPLFFNDICKPPPDPQIDTSATTADVPEHVHSGSSADSRHHYHYILTPRSLWPFCGLPRLRVEDLRKRLPDFDFSEFGDFVYPQRKSLMMGWNWAVFYAQVSHSHLIDPVCELFDESDTSTPLVLKARDPDAPARAEAWIRSAPTPAFLVSVIIDDQKSLCISLAPVGDASPLPWSAKIHAALKECLERAGFLLHPSKDEVGAPVTAVSGVQVNAEAKVAEVAPAKRALLARRSVSLASAVDASAAVAVPREGLASMLSLWSWFMMPARNSLSSFHSIYASLNEARRAGRGSVVLHRGHAHELWCAVGLAPLMVSSLSPIDPVVSMSDASMEGYGVVHKRTMGPVLAQLRSLPRFKGKYRAWGENRDDALAALRWGVTQGDPLACWLRDGWPPLQRGSFFPLAQERWKSSPTRWLVDRWGRWRRRSPPAFINVGEARAAIMMVQRKLRNRSSWGRRSVFILDSQSVVGAVSKGRSSSPSLSRLVSRLSAHVLLGGLSPLWVWVPSEFNPADAPSRWASRRRKR
jgi:hypothetical protein